MNEPTKDFLSLTFCKTETSHVYAQLANTTCDVIIDTLYLEKNKGVYIYYSKQQAACPAYVKGSLTLQVQPPHCSCTLIHTVALKLLYSCAAKLCYCRF